VNNKDKIKKENFNYLVKDLMKLLNYARSTGIHKSLYHSREKRRDIEETLATHLEVINE